ncbi:MAG: F0F1 ATP synthase subunit A [Deltaproteobacteria bacterium]|nr:F0F1 ATP synthase subunit A [Deltaproteobacteria bacterium]
MHGLNWFALLSNQVNEHNIHIITMIFVMIALIGLAFIARKSILATEQSLVPSGKVSSGNIFELIIENLVELMESVIGHGARKHFPLIGTLFIFVFFSNLLGLIPGFLPPTSNINTNIACGLLVFLYFNYMGIKEHGLINYLKHFAGPLWWLAPLIFAIELFGTCIRPITLALRLFCNINADHLVLGIFSGLVPLIIPVVFMILGIFISFVQAFVFTLLSTIYISLATAHEDDHH